MNDGGFQELCKAVHEMIQYHAGPRDEKADGERWTKVLEAWKTANPAAVHALVEVAEEMVGYLYLVQELPLAERLRAALDRLEKTRSLSASSRASTLSEEATEPAPKDSLPPASPSAS